MTYLLTADWHCHTWSQFASVNVRGWSTRLEQILGELEVMAQHAHAGGIERIYVAGDIFHVRGSVKPSVLNPLIETLAELSRKYDITWRIMPGNHDLESRESEKLGSAVLALGEIGAVEVVHEPTWFTDDKVAMIPWRSTREGLTRDITETRTAISIDGGDHRDYDLILHTGINKVLIGVPDHGWEASELAAFGFKRVFAGHYHHHKAFLDNRVVSIGAPTHQTWSDVGTDAGWLEVGETDFDFHPSLAPRFVDFDPDFPGSYAGNYVRVQGLELEEDEIRVLREHLETDGARGVVVHAVAKSKVVTRPGVTPAAGASMETSISDWIKGAGIPEPVQPAVEKLAVEILNEARGA